MYICHCDRLSVYSSVALKTRAVCVPLITPYTQRLHRRPRREPRTLEMCIPTPTPPATLRNLSSTFRNDVSLD